MANPNWVKGKSGNPGGRPKALIDVQELVRKVDTPRNLEVIRDLRDNSDDPGVQLKAALALHEIGWGKPAQQITGGAGTTIVVLERPLPEIQANAGADTIQLQRRIPALPSANEA